MINRLCIFSLLTFLSFSAIADSGQQEIRFKVYLDKKEIGYHNYTIRDRGDVKVIESEASFDVRFLFITAYRYRHLNTEQWVGNCLRTIESTTDANGDRVELEGTRNDSQFVVANELGEKALPECISTFAYWDPKFMQHQKLLNPQTGDYLDVSVEELEPRIVTAKGVDVTARHFRLLADEIQLDLWYSDNNEWIGLQSLAKGGRTIRYELI
jgi:hypothetical protein